MPGSGQSCKLMLASKDMLLGTHWSQWPVPLKPWWLPVLDCGLEPCLGPWHYCSSQGLCWYLLLWGLCGCPGYGQPSGTMLVSSGHTAAGAILTWVACTATGAIVTSKPELLLKAISGFMFLLQLGSVLVSLDLVTTSNCRKHACWNLRSMLSRLCPSLVLG